MSFRAYQVERSGGKTEKLTLNWLHTISAIMRKAGMLRINDTSTLTVTLAAIPWKPFPWELWE